jgi:hypothetical protein
MAQALPRFCPQCGTPTRANIRQCAICGLPVEAMLSHSGNRQSRPGENNDEITSQTVPVEPAQIVPTPRMMQSGNQPYSAPIAPMSDDFQPTWKVPEETSRASQWPEPASAPVTKEVWDLDTINNIASFPDDPPTMHTQIAQDEPYSSPVPPALQAPWETSHTSPDFQPPWATQADPIGAPSQAPWKTADHPPQSPGFPPSWIEPSHAPGPQAKSKRRMGIVLVLLIVLVVLGAGGYVALKAFGGNILGLGNTQSQIKTTQLNGTVTYAGIDITLLNVQQAQNFLNDPQSASDGMVRLNLQEQNKNSTAISWDYYTSAHLLIQGQPALAPTYVQSKGSIAPNATLTSSIDFTVANGGTLNKMTLQLGARGEALILIPLAGPTNLSQYQTKTSAQKGTTIYFGLNWTLTNAVTSLSLPGQQASSGMEYLTLTLKVDNSLSQLAITGSPFDYLRVKAGTQTVTLVNTTLPVSFTSGETGKTGTATFLIPQNNITCSLILLSQDPGGSGQASVNFQIS